MSRSQTQSGPRLCNKCHLPIAFRQLPSGKWCPTNPDGSDHWDDCKRATAGEYKGPLTQYYGRMVDGIMIEDGNRRPINTPEAIAVREKWGIVL